MGADYRELLLIENIEKITDNLKKSGVTDLNPADKKDETDRLNVLIDNNLYQAAYNAYSAESTEKYIPNYDRVFETLDSLDVLLENKRFLSGDTITEPDVKLFVFLSAFDLAYYFVFRLNKKRIKDYDNLWGYAKDLYLLDAFKDVTDFEKIKKDIYLKLTVNPDNILPDGPDTGIWDEKNDRKVKFGITA